jgi:UDP-N-acetylmuramate--alanine ligase
MVGIGGSGMSGLAALLLHRHAHVSGTDATPSTITQRLADSGAKVAHVHAGHAIPQDTNLVVASAAIPPNHPELVAARERNLPIMKYAELLGELMSHGRGVAISGTHGKSTTTAWLAYVLCEADCDPSFIVGATSAQLGGGSRVGDSALFVAEACEYDRSFLNIHPWAAVILNVDEDHLDCYKDLAAIQQTFAAFAQQVDPTGLLLLNGDDQASQQLGDQTGATVETFGFTTKNTWHATDLHLRDGLYAFTLVERGQDRGRFNLGIPGHHNVLNALAVIALARACGVEWERIRTALPGYCGVGRRLELRAETRGIRVVDDYAHHPAEIRATLQAARERFEARRLWCIFQPHQHSRTRFLLEDFAESFEAADRVLVPDIYFVRDSVREQESVNALDLVERIRAHGGDATYMPEFDAIVAHLLGHIDSGDVILTMGAGSIWKVADELVRRL